MVGALIGGAAGAFGFFALTRFVHSVTAGGKINLLWALAFFLLPPAALVGVAFIAKEQILAAGIAMTAVLILSAVAFFITRKFGKSKDIEGDEQNKK